MLDELYLRDAFVLNIHGIKSDHFYTLLFCLVMEYIQTKIYYFTTLAKQERRNTTLRTYLILLHAFLSPKKKKEFQMS